MSTQEARPGRQVSIYLDTSTLAALDAAVTERSRRGELVSRSSVLREVVRGALVAEPQKGGRR